MAKQLAEIKALFNKRFGYRETNWQKEKVQALGGLELDGLYLDGEYRLLWANSESIAKPVYDEQILALKASYPKLQFLLLSKADMLFLREIEQQSGVGYDKWWFIHNSELAIQESDVLLSELKWRTSLFDRIKDLRFKPSERFGEIISALVEKVEQSKGEDFIYKYYFYVSTVGQQPDELKISFWQNKKRKENSEEPEYFYEINTRTERERLVIRSKEEDKDESRDKNSGKDKSLSITAKIAKIIGAVQVGNGEWKKEYTYHSEPAKGILFFLEKADFNAINYGLLAGGGDLKLKTEKEDWEHYRYKVGIPFFREGGKVSDKAIKGLTLESLSLKNIGHFEELEIDLSHRVSCFLGLNGSGKTTILRSIALALTGVYQLEAREPLKGWLKVDRVEETIEASSYKEILALDGSIELYFSSRTKEEKRKHVHRILFKPHEEPIEDHEAEEKVEKFRLLNGREFPIPILGFAQGRTRPLSTKKEEQTSAKNYQGRSTISDLENLITEEGDNKLEELKRWLMITHNEILSLEENIKREEDLAKKKNSQSTQDGHKKAFDLVFELMTEIIGRKISFNAANKDTLWVKLGASKSEDEEEELKEQVISFSRLSQGYKSVFVWAGHLVIRYAEHYGYSEGFVGQEGIIFIDEIDLFLHPLWQTRVLDILVKKFSRARFIVTTHSPLVVSYITDESTDLALYRIVKETVEEELYVKGNGIEDTYGYWMGIKRFPPKITALIAEADNAIRIDTFDEAAEVIEKLDGWVMPESMVVRKLQARLNRRKIIFKFRKK